MLDDIFRKPGKVWAKPSPALNNELKRVRTGRASCPFGRYPGRLLRHPDPIEPDGLPVGARKPADRHSALGCDGHQGDRKAILKSDLGLTPSSDGKMIRIAIPPLTEERRKHWSSPSQDLRRTQDCHPQHPPGCQRTAQGVQKRRRYLRRRCLQGAGPGPEDHRRVIKADRRYLQRKRERNP
jgi:hypothetical protein